MGQNTSSSPIAVCFSLKWMCCLVSTMLSAYRKLSWVLYFSHVINLQFYGIFLMENSIIGLMRMSTDRYLIRRTIENLLTL